MYTTKNLIIGAGISGLMMGHLLKKDYLIIEGANEINRHIPISYFLHTIIPWLPTEFERVQVHTNCWDGLTFHRQPNIGIMNDYSRKIAGRIVPNSLKAFENHSLDWFLPMKGANQIIEDLAASNGSNVICGAKVVHLDSEKHEVDLADGRTVKYQNLISTLPLPFLLSLLRISGAYDFSTRAIYSSSYEADEPVSHGVCQVIYISSLGHSPYRAHMVGPRIIIESMKPMDEAENTAIIKMLWRINKAPKIAEHVIKPGKFHPLPKSQRHALLGMLTSKYNIFCLGRFAVWDHLVTDEVAKDAEKIVEIIKAQESIT